MRRVCIFLTAALLVASAGAAWAEDKPTNGTSVAPVANQTLSVETITLRVDGKIVDAAPPGVIVEITIRLHNFASEIARDVKVHLFDAQDARILDTEATYGNIAAGDTADGVFNVVIGTEPCPDFLGLAGEITHDGTTGVLKIGVPTACPGPRVSIQDVQYTGGDGDGVPEPGESLHVFVVLRNDGRDAAGNVRATVKVTGKDVSSSSAALAWPDIAPGEAERSKTGVAITVAADAPRQEGCPDLPGGGGVAVIPLQEGGTIPPDATMASDGSVGSGTNTSSQPGSEPGSTGSASPGAGSEPAQIEPVPPSTAEPEPGTTFTTAPGTIEPQPVPVEPPPTLGTPGPGPGTAEPAPDRSAAVQLQLEVTATGYTASLDYSNRVACALAEGGVPALDASKQPLAAGTSGSTGSAFPIAMTLILSAAAVAARVVLVR